jgi:O-antigen biosynthesis protein WbqP
MIKRLLDLVFAVSAAIIFAFPYILILIVIRLSSSGPAIYWSRRAGRHGQFFMMPKFRSMRVDTPEVATDKLKDTGGYITPLGSFLRRTSLDELPQIYSVLRGDMSVVGPRPALHNQHELIARRAELGIDQLRPGMTGWAQINGRDEITLRDKLRFDQEYFERQSLFFDLKIILVTVAAVVRSRGVSH